jgi:Putative porin
MMDCIFLQPNMKKLTGIISIATATFFLTAVSARSQSADALIDKLVDKGILTEKEAQELRADSDKNFSDSVQSKLGMPDWVTGYKISGDVRVRYDHLSSDNLSLVTRDRERYRLRFGITVNMADNLEAGFRLASGDLKGTAGNALSANSTMQDNFSKKNIYIDTAYGKWTPVNSGGWMFSATLGKMDNPFNFTPMIFDPDLTPEGAVLQSSWSPNDRHTFSLTGGAFVLDEEQFSTSDPFMYGGQLLWNAKWTEKLSTSVGAGVFQIINSDQLTTANVPYINQGNTRTAVIDNTISSSPVTLYTLKETFLPVIADASATYTLDTFPFYNGTFPIKVAGEYLNNTRAGSQNQGFWTGITFGKSGTKKTWDISYRYERLEADAWYDQLVDDDNGAFWPGDYHGANSGYGYYGGTNVKGHLIKFNYSFTDSFTFSVACFVTDLINRDNLVANFYVPDSKTSASLRIFADAMWKF